MSIREFVEQHPSSSLSISLVQAADNDEQRELLPLLISHAVFADAWRMYFEFAKRNSLVVGDEIIFNAMQSVGLDPYSVSLWLLAMEMCSSTHSKQALYSVALSIPLYNSEKLREKFNTSITNLESSDMTSLLVDEQVDKMNDILHEEKWPDKNVDVLSQSNERCKVKNEWITLIERMLQELYSHDTEERTSVITTDVQCRRINLAFEQMCAQLHNDEGCWYLYALFELTVMTDRTSAVDVLHRAIKICDDNSFMLCNLHAAINIEEQSDDNGDISLNYAGEMLTIKQRLLIEQLLKIENKRKEDIRTFRNVGKQAASDGICDWSLFSQWWKAENVIVNDVKMASRVLENGVMCCSTQLESRCALTAESILFHLLHGHDRECIANGEEQVTVASSTQLRNLRECAQNTLACTKRLLGINTDAEIRQRTEKLTSISSLSHLLTFVNDYRVNNMLPCSSETYNWCVMWYDSKQQKALEKLASSYNVIDYAQSRISGNKCNDKMQDNVNVLPDCNMWMPVELPTNTTTSITQDLSKSNANTDEVVGPRELRGKWVYRPHVSKNTAARVKWEQSRPAELKETTTSGVATAVTTKPVSLSNSAANTNISSLFALKKLTDKLNTLYLNNYQRTELLNASTAWIARQLTINDLDLRNSLTRRRRERESVQQVLKKFTWLRISIYSVLITCLQFTYS